ncbi:MAG: DNA ligase [Thermoflavifilum sp.]|nr:DNA ligase [Thermoflavifilum sp.]MCL6513931.1 DNA ligase [Alicyclobacillus sp.]
MKLDPVIPFEPVRTDLIPDGPSWTAQIKWDGVRVLVYWDGVDCRLFNRHRRERTLQYPELTEVTAFVDAKSVILDGEVIALRDGRPSFYEVMRRDRVRTMGQVQRALARTPIYYMVFDILYKDDRWLTAEPLRWRQEALQEVLRAHPRVLRVENERNGMALFRAAEAQGLEGIVIKDLESTYRVGGKDGRWRKKKSYRDRYAVIGGCVLRNTERAASVLLGLYDEDGRLWYIGHAGTGRLPEEGWVELTRALLRHTQPSSPFVNLTRYPEATWVQPTVVVRVAYIEWPSGHTLRQASIQGVVATPPGTCRLEPGDPLPP